MSVEKAIGLASSSPRRKAALEQIPDIKVVNIGGGEEADHDDLVTIALNKIAFAYPNILKSCQEQAMNLIGILAADTNTLIKVMHQQTSKLERKGKPIHHENTKSYFKKMADWAERNGAGYYEVVAASAFQTSTGSIAGIETTRISLNQAKLRNLASDDGFANYQDQFAQFYNSEAYGRSGCQALSMNDISAGISFPVLTKMGLVEEVNGAKLQELPSPSAEILLKKALLNVAIGFSPQILEQIHPDALTYLMAWSWTNEVVDLILSK